MHRSIRILRKKFYLCEVKIREKNSKKKKKLFAFLLYRVCETINFRLKYARAHNRTFINYLRCVLTSQTSINRTYVRLSEYKMKRKSTKNNFMYPHDVTATM